MHVRLVFGAARFLAVGWFGDYVWRVVVGQQRFMPICGPMIYCDSAIGCRRRCRELFARENWSTCRWCASEDSLVGECV